MHHRAKACSDGRRADASSHLTTKNATIGRVLTTRISRGLKRRGDSPSLSVARYTQSILPLCCLRWRGSARSARLIVPSAFLFCQSTIAMKHHHLSFGGIAGVWDGLGASLFLAARLGAWRGSACGGRRCSRACGAWWARCGRRTGESEPASRIASLKCLLKSAARAMEPRAAAGPSLLASGAFALLAYG
jgi:hypothetical protein